MNRYAFVVFWSEEDGAWVADAPDLRSCSAYGSTPEEAVAELRIAIEAWLETARARGLPLPQARFRPPLAAAE
jgi:predicted RNase H-like HicB family nuclease